MKDVPDTTVRIDSEQRFVELDGLRGFAILLVLIWHYVHAQLRVAPDSPLVYLKQAIGSTWSGVDLFFVLSGFLITGILLDNRDRRNYFRVFYLRRACRIFPVYYLNLAMFFVLMLLGLNEVAPFGRLFRTGEVPLWSYAVYLQNVYMGMHTSFGPEWLAVSWSLAVEEQFYLLFPLVVRIMPASRLPFVFLWFIIMAIYLRSSLPGFTAFINTPWRADSLMIGAMSAWFVRQPGFLSHVVRHRYLVFGLFGLLLAGALVTNVSPNRPFSLPFTYLWLALLYAMLMLICISFRNSFIAGIFRNRVLIWLGSISYGVYLFHQPVSGIVHGLLRHGPPYIVFWSDVPVTLLALCITLGLAHLSYHYFEKRILRYGRSRSYG